MKLNNFNRVLLFSLGLTLTSHVFGQMSREALLKNTYLGHSSELVLPTEPTEVLNAYLSLNRHGYLQELAASTAGFNVLLQQWTEFAASSPASIHALVGLAAIEMIQAKVDTSVAAGAATHLILAEEIALAAHRVLYVNELADALATAGDVVRLDQVFNEIFATADVNPPERHAALVAYASALARLGDTRAGDYYYQAVTSYRDNNVAAATLYSDYLFSQGDSKGALTAIESNVSPELLRVFPSLIARRVSLRKDLGLDATEAQGDADAFLARLGSNAAGVSILNENDGRQLKAALAELGKAGADAAHPDFSHTNTADDCRGPYYNVPTYEVLFDGYYVYFYPFTINLAEILYNEAGPSLPWGEPAMVGWTVRDRVYEEPASYNVRTHTFSNCNAYPGGYGSSLGTSLGCAQSGSFCPDSANYCRAEHGGTTSVGASEFQFNDGHVDSNTLDTYQYDFMAVDVMNNLVAEIYDGYTPTGASGCSYTCSNPFCSSGTYTSDASPFGPMEFQSSSYTSSTSCVHIIGQVCTGGNYYYGRSQSSPI